MTTTTEIIQDAMRETNLIGANEYPNQKQQSEAMRSLARLVSGVYGDDVGERLEDWMVDYDGQFMPDQGWTELQWRSPIQNSRVLLNHTIAQTLYFPRRPDNGARMRVIDVQGVLATYPVTLWGNGRLVEGAEQVVLNTDDLNAVWLYDAESADWKRISSIAINQEMPFPLEFDDYFIIKLAGRLNPRYGRSLDDASIARLAEMQAMLESTYRQKRNMPVAEALSRLTSPGLRGGWNGRRGGRFGWM